MGAGVAFIQDPEGARYEDAYPQFKRAYELTCSVNALQNLALCEMKIELDGDAIVHYEKVLAEKTDLADADRRQIESDLARLKATVAWITLSASADGVKLTDERTPRRGAIVRNTYQIGTQKREIGIHPGSHVFTAVGADGKTATWKVEIASGARQEHHFSLVAPSSAPGPVPPGPVPPGPQPPPGGDTGDGGGFPIYVWVVGGVTVASAIVMVAMMAVSASKKSEYDDEILGQAPLAEQEAAASDVQTFSALADVFIGVTVAAAATTVVLALLAPSTEAATNNKEGPKFGVDYTVAPVVSDHGGGAGITVRF